MFVRHCQKCNKEYRPQSIYPMFDQALYPDCEAVDPGYAYKQLLVRIRNFLLLAGGTALLFWIASTLNQILD